MVKTYSRNTNQIRNRRSIGSRRRGVSASTTAVDRSFSRVSVLLQIPKLLCNIPSNSLYFNTVLSWLIYKTVNTCMTLKQKYVMYHKIRSKFLILCWRYVNTQQSLDNRLKTPSRLAKPQLTITDLQETWGRGNRCHFSTHHSRSCMLLHQIQNVCGPNSNRNKT
jgi:hypothetical protein